MSLTPEQLHVLQHSLGLDEHGQGKMYRNHFCAGGTDVPICESLVAMGYMETFTRSYLPYYNCTVTESGKEAVRRESPPPPKLTRSQRRYRDYLRADTGRGFMEWLQDVAAYERERRSSFGPDEGAETLRESGGVA